VTTRSSDVTRRDLMTERTRLRRATPAAALLAVALMASACTGGGTKSLETGPGVATNEIRIGVLTDLSGSYEALGKGATQGNEIFWREKNAAGGVCGREVKLVIKDHGYDQYKALELYAEVKDDVLGLQQSLGSPMTTILLPQIEQDKMVTAPVSWASSLLTNPYVQITGTAYDLEMANGVDDLIDRGVISRGDTVGHIYNAGEYGNNGLAGAKFVAKKAGLTLLGEQINPRDPDMTKIAAKWHKKGTKAIFMTTATPQVESVAAYAKKHKWDVTLLLSNPSWAASVLESPAIDWLESHALIVQSWAPASSGEPAVTKVREAFKAAYPNEAANPTVTFGYAQALVFSKILEKACESGKLTRDGMADAFLTIGAVSTDGLLPPLDYAKQGQSPARQVYVLRPDRLAFGGLTVDRKLFEGNHASSYVRTLF
jgi:ABC-type branched-subunit amino acid transport system substrate-binding protein